MFARAGSTTRRSMSLSLVIWPVAAEPNRMILSGRATERTRRTISFSNVSSTPIRFHDTRYRARVSLGPQAKRRETEKRHARAETRKALRKLAKSRNAKTGRRESSRKRLGSAGSGGLELARRANLAS